MESDQSGIAPLASVPSTQADDPVSHPHGIEHPIDQNSIGQSIEHSIEHSIGQSIGQSIEGSIGQSIGDSIERSIANSISIDHHGAHVSPITTTQHQLEEQLRQHYGQLNQPQMQVGAFDTDSADPNHAPTLTQTLSAALSSFNATYDANAWGKRPTDQITLDGGVESSPVKRQRLDTHQEFDLPLQNPYQHEHTASELQAAVMAAAQQQQHEHEQQQQQHEHELQHQQREHELQHQQHEHELQQQQQQTQQQQQHEHELQQQQHEHELQQQREQQQQQQHQQQQHQLMEADPEDGLVDILQSEEADYEDDDEVEGSPFQTHQDHLMNPFRGTQQQWTTPTNLMDDSTAVLWSANHGMRVRSLPVVDNLSTQILMTLGKGGYQETLNIVTCPESDSGQAYSLLKGLFDQTKKIYTHDAFLSCEELKLDSPEQRAIIRKVNLATFVSSVFGSQEVGFFHLNECFLDTFIPEGGRLLKSQGALYLDLKTQAYISALSTGERDRIDILNDLFPDDIAHQLLMRRQGAKGLTPSEADFVQRAHQRKQHLLQLPEDTVLSDKYVWQDFLQDVSSYVSKHFDQIMAQPVRKTRKRQPSSHNTAYRGVPQSSSPYQPQPQYNTIAVQLPMQAEVVDHQQQQLYQPQPEYELPQHHTTDDVVAATAAALSAAHSAAQEQLQHQHQEMLDEQQHHQLQSHDVSQSTPMYDPNATGEVQPHHMQAHSGAPVANMTMSLGHPPVASSIPAQTTPTQVLYERARLAAQSKASPNARRSGLPSQRRPWTPEEETALMAGLDRVKGPHWSQILAMFGPGGTINEVLKDRNQVQLKDKARNLKLFFLKSGIEVPYYLQFVTGELKTRAPSQAAKQQKLKQQQQQQQMVMKDGGSTQYRDETQSSDDDGGAISEAARAQARAQAQAHIDAVNALNGEINRQDSINIQNMQNMQDMHQQALAATQEHHHLGGQELIDHEHSLGHIVSLMIG